jgi:SAM-dependent methyltransferase
MQPPYDKMNDKSTWRFEYSHRDQCPCGESLQSSQKSIVKKFPRGDISFAQCDRCLSWVQSPALTPASLSNWFESWEYWEGGRQKSGIYVDYQGGEASRQVEGEARYADSLSHLLPKVGNILEIGCATGSQLAVLKKHGHTATGIDISTQLAESAKTLNGIDVIAKDFMEVDLPDNSFDLILMLGVVSNLSGISRYIERIRNLLVPGGFLNFTFPDAASLSARIYGEKHWMYTPSVNTFYSQKCIENLCAKAGLQIVSIKHDKQKPVLAKAFSLAGLSLFGTMLKSVGASNACLPVQLPIPGVLSVVCQNQCLRP